MKEVWIPHIAPKWCVDVINAMSLKLSRCSLMRLRTRDEFASSKSWRPSPSSAHWDGFGSYTETAEAAMNSWAALIRLAGNFIHKKLYFRKSFYLSYCSSLWTGSLPWKSLTRPGTDTIKFYCNMVRLPNWSYLRQLLILTDGFVQSRGIWLDATSRLPWISIVFG